MDWFRKLFKQIEEAKGSARVFLDYASATPMLPEVRKEMERFFEEDFYNPNAIYEEGVRVRKAVDEYRTRLARLLGVAPDSIIFTSGGTEANALAVRGVKPGQVIVEPDSHSSVIEAVVKNDSKEITLVSSVTTDNKLGREIRAERKKKNSAYPLLHVDASQTAGYFNVSPEALACDLLTLDSAKLYGPKGIGALVVRKGVKLDLPPRGTPPVPLIAGFVKAFELAVQDREAEASRLNLLSAQFAEAVSEAFPQATVTQVPPNIVYVSVPDVLPEYLVLALDRKGIMASAGPACEAHKPEPAETPVRFSFGRQTTEKDIQEAVKTLCQILENVLKSPHVAAI